MKDDAFEGNVRLECPGCNTNIIVMPSKLYTAISDLSGVEGEIQFREVRQQESADWRQPRSRRRRSAYTCPVCGERGQLPPEDELRRLAEEQGGPRIP